MFLGDSIHLKELFIQPTRWCAGSCYKCYVKQHFSSNQQTPWPEQVELVKTFLRGEEHSAEQISISIDELPDDDEKRYHMVAFVHGVLEAMKKSQSAYLTFTMQSPSTYLSYLDAGISPSEFEKVDCIAFSDLICSDAPFLKAAIKNEKCFNWQMSNTSAINDFKFLLPVLDYVYCIFPKYQNFVSIGITDIIQKYFKENQHKFIIDVCLDDAQRYQYFRRTCSGGISKFQIWPDGSVSACPYARSSYTQPGLTAKHIIENIKQTHLTLDFDQCPVLQSLSLDEGININDYRI